MGWAIINISTLSFLGVQAFNPGMGAINEAKDVLTSNPTQMIAPGIAIVVLVCCFNLMGDALRMCWTPRRWKMTPVLELQDLHVLLCTHRQGWSW